jgi:hypothetical protein
MWCGATAPHRIPAKNHYRDLDRLFDLLTAYQSDLVTNQYLDVDPDLDRPDGARVRCRNLRFYLEAFAGARWLLVGEAAGYAGCRFSGIPFTCEAQIVGAGRLGWVEGYDLARSSRAETLWVERSATMVWETLGERRDVVLWNAFPWHPFGPRGPLSNRHPGHDVGAGLEVLGCLLALFRRARPYAIGRVAERALADVGVAASYIRHPSRGGKARFAAGVATLPGK